jgi:hypothetical protein
VVVGVVVAVVGLVVVGVVVAVVGLVVVVVVVAVVVTELFKMLHRYPKY